MATMTFTDVSLRALKIPQAGQLSYWDEKLPTFGIRVSQGGAKTFVLKRDNALITIGRFPIIGLSDARTEAKRLLAEFTLGKERPHAISYQNAVRLFLEDKQKYRRPRTIDEYKRLLNRAAFKGVLENLREHEVAWHLSKITAPAEYNHLLVTFRVFENWCRRRGYITRSLTAGLSKHARSSRTRVLSNEELKSIWRACEFPPLPSHFAKIVRLLILTGQRKSEIGALQFSWINFDNQSITIPASFAKNRREHNLPYGKLSGDLLSLNRQAGSFCFPARGKTDQPFNGWSKSKDMLDKLSGVSDWTLHDLRRTFATRLAELGVAPHIIERLLNHSTGIISGVAATYNRARYVPEMRHAIELWERHLEAILKGSNSRP